MSAHRRVSHNSITVECVVRGFFKGSLIFAVILLASAFLAPLLYQFLPYKFERIFNRMVMILSLAALAVSLKGKKLRISDYGLAWQGQPAVKYLLTGFLTGIAVLAVFSFVKVAAGQAVWNVTGKGPVFWMLRLGAALGAAFLIAFIEEFFFRGAVYRTLSDQGRKRIYLAYGLTSFFYSIVHFVSFKKPFVTAHPGFSDGLRLVAAPFQSLLHFGQYWPEALGLFLFGLVLNHAAAKAGSLYPSIGLHAGCVFYVKTDALFLLFEDKNRFLFASGKFYDGLLGWGFLLLMGILMTAAVRRIRTGKGAA